MNIGARGIIGLVETVLDRLNDDLAGVNTDTNLQIRIADPLDALLHGQGGEATANGVILVRLRRAEQRHDAIALRFVDDAVVAKHGLIHEVEDGLQPPQAEFGIAQAVDQSGRIANVRKQYGQALALAALGVERLENVLAGRVSLSCDGLTQPGAAVSAEPARCSVKVSTGLACDPERGATPFAILVSRLVLTTAAQTLHC